MGGLTVSQVAQAQADHLAAVVCLAALVLPFGMTPIASSQDPALPQGVMFKLFAADMGTVGATRIIWLSTEPAYAAQVKSLFYPDADEEAYRHYTARLQCDEPHGPFFEPSPITPARFGKVPRHYVRTTEELELPLAA
jgi:hypothetical protein